MNKRTYSQILDDVARDHLAENTDLAPQIINRVQKGKGASMQPRMKVFVTAILILLVMMVVLVNVPAVAAAIQRWFGYVPGIGLVPDGQIRVLAEPVSVTREGITLTVEQVVVDPERTTVVYTVEGLTQDILDSAPANNTPGCYRDAVLRLPENELTPLQQNGTSWITGYEHKAGYPSIPSNLDEVTFALPCIRSALPGKAPEDWKLSLRLIPAPPDMTAFPVIEISTPLEATARVQPQGNIDLSLDSVSLTLDRAVQMDDGYLLYATLHWENAGLSLLDVFDPSTVHLLDADGQVILISLDYEAMIGITPTRGQTGFAIKTVPIQVPGPLTLTLDSASVIIPVEASFTFDPGPNPQPGQVWELNQDVNVGYGHTLRVLKATYSMKAAMADTPGLSFEMDSETGVNGATLVDMGHPLVTGGGGGGGSYTGPFSSGFSYAEGFPTGPITVNVESIAFNLPGHWQAQWTPPAAAPQIVPTHTAACLNKSSWKQALNQNPQLPEGLGGKVVLYGPSADNPDVWVTSLSGLDGSNPQVFGDGDGSFSPDGSKLAFSRLGEGISIMDLASNQTVGLPGTTDGDFNPTWSPDGSQIAFMRGMGVFDLFVVNADGSNQRRLTSHLGQEWVAGWMPDGQHLIYMLPGKPYEYTNYLIDVQTGASQVFSSEEMQSLSADGRYKIVAERQSGNMDFWAAYVSDMDGSNRWMLSEGDMMLSAPIWSPDAQWLLVTVSEWYSSDYVAALIHLSDCQIIPLPHLKGEIKSWTP